MGGRHMPAEHLPTPATIQADDMIAVNGSPDRNRGGSLDDGFWCRLTEATERLMNSRDQWGELIRLDLIASNIGAMILAVNSDGCSSDISALPN
jgi:hypothetical protein